jgi:AraC family transcriptional regulator
MDVQPHLLNLSAYINQNLEKDLPLSHLAQRVGLSPFHFHRKFGAYFGESLHQHIKRLRLERAAYSLVNSGTPVRQIARDSGYKTVSAFSHAFSGFAGESPTRYRSLASAKRDGEASGDDGQPPAWIGRLESIEFAFVRAKGNGQGTQGSIREALDLIVSRAGPLMDGPAEGDGDDFGYIAATSDFYGISNDGTYRLDIGVEASRVSPERRASLGLQTLPGGRYARFDLHCAPDDVMGRGLRWALRGIVGDDAPSRLSQYFLRFGPDATAGDPDGPRDFRLFVPLSD